MTDHGNWLALVAGSRSIRGQLDGDRILVTPTCVYLEAMAVGIFFHDGAAVDDIFQVALPAVTAFVGSEAVEHGWFADLQKADQHEPLNLVMLAQAYEKSGDAAQAKAYYTKVLELNVHNPTNAFARPLAKKKLEGGA